MDISNLLTSSEEPPCLLSSVSAETSIMLKIGKVLPRKDGFSWESDEANIRQAQQ